MYERENILLTRLELNEGQIPGVPENPRRITDAKLKSLIDSIDNAREMLELRELLVYPVGEKFVVIGGNMRLRALRSLDVETVPCKILNRNIPADKLREYAIKDNIESGEWDIPTLNLWDGPELNEWGIDFIPGNFDLNSFFDEDEETKQKQEKAIICPHCGRDINKQYDDEDGDEDGDDDDEEMDNNDVQC